MMQSSYYKMDPITRGFRGQNILILLFVPVCALLVTLAVGTARAACDPGFVQVNEDGFGDATNDYAWAMKVFGGLLYVSTYNQSKGGEIWRYDGETWEQVVSGGLGNSANRGARNLIIFQGALYGGVYNQSTGAQLWRSTDGETWEVVVTGGFGDQQNISVRGMEVFTDPEGTEYLYVGLQGRWFFGGIGQLHRSVNGEDFEPVTENGFGSPGNVSLHALTVFNDYLYVGTKNNNGLEIWRTSDGFNFEPVVGPGAATPSGFGVSSNAQVYDLEVFDGYMYVGLANLSGYRVYRTVNGTDYQQVLQSSDPDEEWSWRFGVYEDHIWLGTFNSSVMYTGPPYQGGSVLRSPDGLSWETMVGVAADAYEGPGFNDYANWGMRAFEAYQPPGAPTPHLYIGTANCWTNCGGDGAEVWEWPGETCEGDSDVDGLDLHVASTRNLTADQLEAFAQEFGGLGGIYVWDIEPAEA